MNMQVCSKCQQNLPSSNFYTYFHSTQNKVRTRKECNDCYRKKQNQIKANKRLLNQLNLQNEQVPQNEKIIQPVVSNEEPEVLIPTKQCNKCKDSFPMSFEYFYKNNNTKTGFDRHCRKCRMAQQSAYDKRMAEEEWGGSLRIPVKTGEYGDDEQKEFVFKFLPKLGWEYSNETGRWFKPGVKDKNNNWVGIIPRYAKNGRKILRPYIAMVTVNNKRTRITDEIIDHMVEVYNTIQNFTKMGRMYDTSPQNITKWVKERMKHIANSEQ